MTFPNPIYPPNFLRALTLVQSRAAITRDAIRYHMGLCPIVALNLCDRLAALGLIAGGEPQIGVSREYTITHAGWRYLRAAQRDGVATAPRAAGRNAPPPLSRGRPAASLSVVRS